MIIGIIGSGKQEKKEFKEYFNTNYNFKYLNVDEILDNLVKEKYLEKIKKNNWHNIDLLLEIRNRVDEEIEKRVKELSNDETIVVDYSLLKDSYFANKCDLLIKAENTSLEEYDELNNIKEYNSDNNKIYNSEIDYHIKLDMKENWQEKLNDFINYNLYKDTKISVIVPIHNTSKYLTKCINSITNQTYKNLEIILIDDGSTDNSLEICKILEKTDDRITVIHQENIGLSETRNKGMDLATGEYICFIDSDDYIDNNMFETLLKEIEKTNADVCEGSFYIHMKNGRLIDASVEQKGIKYVENKLDLINAYSNATILIPAWDKLYRLSSIKNIKFDKNCFKEDSDYIYKLCMAEKTFALVDKPFYHYVKRKSTSITGNKISKKLFTLQDWGKEKYQEVLSEGEKYRDAAEKILYNSLVHIIRYFMRDYKNGMLEKDELKEEIQSVVNDTLQLLLTAKDVKKFRKLDEVLDMINTLIEAQIVDKEKMPVLELPCIGILWNSLDQNMMNEALDMIKDKATITDDILIDLKDEYREFINEIYFHNHECEGVSFIKASTLIDKFDSNNILILNMIIKVKNYIYFNNLKGYMFEEVADLKSLIRKTFKNKIKEYAYDNVFHLTVDMDEYEYTDQVCRKLVKGYNNHEN